MRKESQDGKTVGAVFYDRGVCKNFGSQEAHAVSL
jgi:hypothetical protein